MATRFYLPSSGAADVSPTISGTDWTHINTDRRKMSPTKANSAFAATVYAPDAVDHIAAGQSHFVQFVSAILDPQTISAQTVSLAVLNLESNAGNNCFINWKIYAVSVDGSTELGTLLARRADATEMGTTQINRTDSATSTSFTSGTQFRLVFEIGIGGTPVATSQVQGHNGTIRFGDPTGGADLAANDTATVDAAPWLNFATSTLVFTPPTTPISASATQAQSVSIALQRAGALVAPQAQAGTLVRVQARQLAATQAQASSVTKTFQPGAVQTPVALAGTQAQVVTAARRATHILTGTQPQVSTPARLAVHAIAGTQLQVVTVQRGIAHALAGTQAQVVTATRIRAAGVLLSGTQAQSVALARARAAGLAGTQPQVVSLTAIRGGTTPVALSGTQAQSVGRTTGFVGQRTLNAAQAQSVSVQRARTATLQGAQAQLSGLVRGTARGLVATQPQFSSAGRRTIAALVAAQPQSVGALQRRTAALSGTQAQAVSVALIRGGTTPQGLAGTQAQVVTSGTMLAYGRTLAGTQVQVVGLGQAPALGLVAAQAQATELVRQATVAGLLGTQMQVVALQRWAGLTAVVLQAQVVSAGRGIPLPPAVWTQAQMVSAVVGLGARFDMALTGTQAQIVTLTYQRQAPLAGSSSAHITTTGRSGSRALVSSPGTRTKPG